MYVHIKITAAYSDQPELLRKFLIPDKKDFSLQSLQIILSPAVDSLTDLSQMPSVCPSFLVPEGKRRNGLGIGSAC